MTEWKGSTTHIEVGTFDFYVHMMEDDDGNLKWFHITASRTGSDLRLLMITISNLINLAIDKGATAEEIVETMRYMRGETSGFLNVGNIKSMFSVPDLVAQMIERRYCNDI